MLARGQKKALHSAFREAQGCAPHLDEDARRLIQTNVGGFWSAADQDAPRRGFIRVMAYYENLCGGKLHGSQAGYWAGEERGARPNDSLVWKVRQIQAAAGFASDEEVDRFLGSERMSGDRYRAVSEAPSWWLVRLIEALKAMAARRAGPAGRGAGSPAVRS